MFRPFRIIESGDARVLILEFPDRPRYEVKLYRVNDAPVTLLITDQLTKAEAKARQAARSL